MNLYLPKEFLLSLLNSLLSFFLHLLLKLFKLFYPPTMSMFLKRFQAIHLRIDWFEEIIQKFTAQTKQNTIKCLGDNETIQKKKNAKVIL